MRCRPPQTTEHQHDGDDQKRDTLLRVSTTRYPTRRGRYINHEYWNIVWNIRRTRCWCTHETTLGGAPCFSHTHPCNRSFSYLDTRLRLADTRRRVSLLCAKKNVVQFTAAWSRGYVQGVPHTNLSFHTLRHGRVSADVDMASGMA